MYHGQGGEAIFLFTKYGFSLKKAHRSSSNRGGGFFGFGIVSKGVVSEKSHEKLVEFGQKIFKSLPNSKLEIFSYDGKGVPEGIVLNSFESKTVLLKEIINGLVIEFDKEFSGQMVPYSTDFNYDLLKVVEELQPDPEPVKEDSVGTDEPKMEKIEAWKAESNARNNPSPGQQKGKGKKQVHIGLPWFGLGVLVGIVLAFLAFLASGYYNPMPDPTHGENGPVVQSDSTESTPPEVRLTIQADQYEVVRTNLAGKSIVPLQGLLSFASNLDAVEVSNAEELFRHYASFFKSTSLPVFDPFSEEELKEYLVKNNPNDFEKAVHFFENSNAGLPSKIIDELKFNGFRIPSGNKKEDKESAIPNKSGQKPSSQNANSSKNNGGTEKTIQNQTDSGDLESMENPISEKPDQNMDDIKPTGPNTEGERLDSIKAEPKTPPDNNDRRGEEDKSGRPCP